MVPKQADGAASAERRAGFGMIRWGCDRMGSPGRYRVAPRRVGQEDGRKKDGGAA